MAGTGKGPTPRQQLFGERVRRYRKERGLSQEALAQRAGIDRTYVGGLETGERNISLDNIARLAAALEVDAADLVRGLQDVPGRPKPAG